MNFQDYQSSYSDLNPQLSDRIDDLKMGFSPIVLYKKYFSSSSLTLPIKYLYSKLERRNKMDATTYTQARKNFAAVMNRVCDDHAPIIITRQNERPVVMISLEDYNAIEETLYLVKSSKNASRLAKSLGDLKERKTEKHDLIES